jgi:hypothetical protein
VLTDSRIYLNKKIIVGNKEKAEKEGWVSWPQLREQYKSDE